MAIYMAFNIPKFNKQIKVVYIFYLLTRKYKFKLYFTIFPNFN